MKRDERSGTTIHDPKTDIVVAVAGMIVVTIHGPRVHLIVDPRAAPQVRRSKPHKLPCARYLSGKLLRCQKAKYFSCAFGARITGLSSHGLSLRPVSHDSDQEEGGRQYTTRKPKPLLRTPGGLLRRHTARATN